MYICVFYIICSGLELPRSAFIGTEKGLTLFGLMSPDLVTLDAPVVALYINIGQNLVIKYNVSFVLNALE
jgi:hypothetical protein